MPYSVDLRRARILSGEPGGETEVWTEAAENCDGVVCTLQDYEGEAIERPLEFTADGSWQRTVLPGPGVYLARSLRGPRQEALHYLVLSPDGRLRFLNSASEMRAALKDAARAQVQAQAAAAASGTTAAPAYGALPPLAGGSREVAWAEGIREKYWHSLAGDDVQKRERSAELLALIPEASWWVERRDLRGRDLLLSIVDTVPAALQILEKWAEQDAAETVANAGNEKT